MMRISYKQRYEELRADQELEAARRTDKRIIQHTKGYIHIKWIWLARLLFLLGSVALAVANFFLIISVGHTSKVWELIKPSATEGAYRSYSQLIILYPMVGEYLLIVLCVICLGALIKGGFHNLGWDFDDEGLIHALGLGLIFGAVIALMFVLIGGSQGLICGIILGVGSGLAAALLSSFFVWGAK